MLRVSCDEIDYDENRIFSYCGQPFTGIGFKLYEDGRALMEISFVNGMKEGTTRIWFPDGQLKSEKNFHYSSRHGISQEWYESGTLKEREVIEHAILLESETYNPDGTVASQYQLNKTDPNYERLERLRKTRGA